MERSSSGGGGGGRGSLGSLEQLDLLLEKEQGVVRRAGWLSFKALITLNKERRLEMVARRKWRHYWVTLKGTGRSRQSLEHNKSIGSHLN